MALFEKYFTVEEANALVPELRRIVREIQEEIRKSEDGRGEFAKAAETISSNGGGKKLEAVFHAGEFVRERLQRIAELGVQIKDPRRGLLDFPALRNGEEILLCWLIEEPQVEYWHDLVQGFAGRRPVSEL
jgi:hypothetical protein